MGHLACLLAGVSRRTHNTIPENAFNEFHYPAFHVSGESDHRVEPVQMCPKIGYALAGGVF